MPCYIVLSTSSKPTATRSVGVPDAPESIHDCRRPCRWVDENPDMATRHPCTKGGSIPSVPDVETATPNRPSGAARRKPWQCPVCCTRWVSLAMPVAASAVGCHVAVGLGHADTPTRPNWNNQQPRPAPRAQYQTRSAQNPNTTRIFRCIEQREQEIRRDADCGIPTAHHRPWTVDLQVTLANSYSLKARPPSRVGRTPWECGGSPADAHAGNRCTPAAFRRPDGPCQPPAAR